MQPLATNNPFAQNHAHLVALPVPCDGVVLNATLLRFLAGQPEGYRAYRELAVRGELHLGDCFVHKVQKTVAGLSVGSSRSPDYLAFLATHHHATHAHAAATIKIATQKLADTLFNLMRHHDLRHAAVFANHWFDERLVPIAPNSAAADLPHKSQISNDALKLWAQLSTTLNVPHLKTQIFISKQLDLALLQQSAG